MAIVYPLTDTSLPRQPTLPFCRTSTYRPPYPVNGRDVPATPYRVKDRDVPIARPALSSAWTSKRA